MPHSGIRLSDDVKHKYDLVFKREKKSQADKLPYAVFKFNDGNTEIIVDYDPKFYEKHLTYSELVDLLPNNSPRFFCYDFPHLDKDGNKNSAVVVVSWFPVSTPVKQKFIAGSSFLHLVAQLSVSKKNYIEGEESADIDEASICSNQGAWKVCPTEMYLPLPEGPVNIKPGNLLLVYSESCLEAVSLGT